MAEAFRQGSIHRPLRVRVFTQSAAVDFTTEFPGGVTFRMVHGTTVITGTATGDASGNLSYPWQAGDLDVVGSYAACFIGTDADGKTETFPAGSNLEIMVFAVL